MVIHYMDNRGNSRASTCAQPRLRASVVFITYHCLVPFFALSQPACEHAAGGIEN